MIGNDVLWATGIGLLMTGAGLFMYLLLEKFVEKKKKQEEE